MNRKKFFDVLPPKRIVIEKIEEKKPKRRFKNFFLSFLFFLIFLTLFSYYVLAKVKIDIWPKTQTLDFEERILADVNSSKIDFANKILPAKILEIKEEASQEFPASGKIEKEAEGKIRVYNKNNFPVTLKSGTRFQSANKEVIYFCSQTKFTIPAKGFIDLPVKACFVKSGEGEKYNIGPSKFSVPGLSGSELFFTIYGESSEPMKGGGTFFQVTKDDLDKGKNILTDVLFSKLEESLKKENLNEIFILNETIKKEVLEINSNLKEGEIGDFFTLNGKGKLIAFSLQKSDLENFAREIILAQISKDLKFQKESLKIDFQLESIDLEKGKVILKSKFSAKIFPDINLVLLKENLKGKSLAESKKILENREDIIKAQISTFPFFLQKIPNDEKKIEMLTNL
jgi:hypothetical protein